MTNTWHYTVFYGDSLDSLNESIRSGRPLRPDAVAGVSGGFLAAAVYIAEHSSRIEQELLAHLEGRATSLPESELKLVGPICADTSKAVVWMFPGQGAQRVDLLKGLYRRSQFFRDTLNQYFEVASDETGENFLEALYPKEGANDETESRLTKTSICQPVMLGLTLALVSSSNAMDCVVPGRWDTHSESSPRYPLWAELMRARSCALWRPVGT